MSLHVDRIAVRLSLARRLAASSSSSSTVASLFKTLARQDTTHTLPGTYPIVLSMRSTVGLLSVRGPPLRRGIPRSGHTSGITISSGDIVNSIPLFFALDLQIWHRSHSG